MFDGMLDDVDDAVVGDGGFGFDFDDGAADDRGVEEWLRGHGGFGFGFGCGFGGRRKGRRGGFVGFGEELHEQVDG